MTVGEKMVFAAAFVAERNRVQKKVDDILNFYPIDAYGPKVQEEVTRILATKEADAARAAHEAVAALKVVLVSDVPRDVENMIHSMLSPT